MKKKKKRTKRAKHKEDIKIKNIEGWLIQKSNK